MKKKKFFQRFNLYVFYNFLKIAIFLFFIFLFLAFFLNFLIPKIKDNYLQIEIIPDLNNNKFFKTIEQKDYLYYVFYATFSSFGWLDNGQTNMENINSMSAFTYPIKVKINSINDSNLISFLKIQENKFLKEKEEEKRLNSQFYDNFFPLELKDKKIIESFFKKIDNLDIIVFKEEKDNLFNFWFYFNQGDGFKKINNGFLFQSKYDGLLNIFGDRNNLLVVLSAYEGKAAQIKDLKEIKDISYIFEIRVMGGGNYKFNLERIKLNDKNFWYLWVKENNFFKLIKLFEDDEGKIVGGAELTHYFYDYFKNLSFDLMFFDSKIFSDKIIIYFKYGDNYFEFLDEGFDKKSEKMITSLNINNYLWPPAKIKISSLAGNYFGNDDFILEVSNDKIIWQEIELDREKEINFNTPTFYWRIRLKPNSNIFDSVFLRGFEINLFLDKKN